MKTLTLLALLVAAAALSAPLSVLGSANEDTFKELKLTRFVEPVFPESVRLDGVAEGSVTLAVSRNPAGEPVDVLVLRATHPKLALAAEEAVRLWRFAPAEVAEPAPRLIQLGFRLQGVVLFPAGKNLEDEMANRMVDKSSRVLLSVPRLQNLNQVPKALSQPMPRYPAVLADRGLTGTASVSFYVDEAGRVRLPEVVDATTPEFADAAMAAVAQWRYEPPRSGGRAVVARDTWEFKFQATTCRRIHVMGRWNAASGRFCLDRLRRNRSGDPVPPAANASFRLRGD